MTLDLTLLPLPSSPEPMGDTICKGDTSNLMAISDDFIVWTDSANNVIGFGDSFMTMDSTTTSYYAEARIATELFSDDFESYNVGNLIAQTSEVWGAWSGVDGGGDDDAAVSSDQAADGSNSLYLDYDNGDDVVLPLGNEAFDTGIIILEMDMHILTNGYFNLQTDPTPGLGWAFSVFFEGNSVDISEGATNTALSGTYPGPNEWFNIALALDIDNNIGEMFIDGKSQGTFEFTSDIGGVNIYANTDNKYFIDNVAAGFVTDCSSEQIEVILTVEECVGINTLEMSNVKIYPNPNNGEFIISNSIEINKIDIISVQGKVVRTINNINLKTIDINLTDLDKGMYLINIETSNGRTTKPVMVK